LPPLENRSKKSKKQDKHKKNYVETIYVWRWRKLRAQASRDIPLYVLNNYNGDVLSRGKIK
jgi:hypothetical protein